MQKIIDPNVAANAYSNSVGVGNKAVSGDNKAFARGESFSDLLQDAGKEAVQTMREGEEMSAKAISEDANLNEVIQAVNAAEITLQTVVAMRDKLVGAYQEIMRMPI